MAMWFQWMWEPFAAGADFNSLPAIEWTQEHSEIPVFCVMAYLAFIFQVPPLLQDKPPLKLKGLFAAWNLLLSLFSFAGFYYTVPVLVANLWANGFRYTVCTDPVHWYLRGPPGLWVMLFIYSKIPELFDTVFLVLRKRQVIFLHWFHHCTVLLYCWHAYHNRIAPGLWFAGMNYSVHSVMYLYYFLQTVGMLRTVTKRIAPLITSIQILQMVMGVVVTFSSAVWHHDGGEKACFVNPANYKLGLGMYGIYFVLFAFLFKKLYLSGPAGKRQPGRSEREFCGVGMETGDAAGHFLTRRGVPGEVTMSLDMERRSGGSPRQPPANAPSRAVSQHSPSPKLD
eukprot:TRINITY_DN10239_c0_g1_i1.p1 TRINITY_DN10239_c0_g1~~TRINITY_DN10239_c0_g1_i1.p1  ORF type:complete len:369 (+),score=155.58 TRINITY_DN10239_c0_g1_i1:89-1108(+)